MGGSTILGCGSNVEMPMARPSGHDEGTHRTDLMTLVFIYTFQRARSASGQNLRACLLVLTAQ